MRALVKTKEATRQTRGGSVPTAFFVDLDRGVMVDDLLTDWPIVTSGFDHKCNTREPSQEEPMGKPRIWSDDGLFADH